VQRVFGAIAIFAGWLSIGIGAMAGMAVSQFFGLNHVEGDLPPVDVYGISGELVLWVFVGAAIVMSVPLGAAMFEADPRRHLRWWAAALAVAGAALIPDSLGRAYGLPLLAGAACLVIGGELVHRQAVALESAGGRDQVSQSAFNVDTAQPGGVAGQAASDTADSQETASPSTPPDSGATRMAAEAPVQQAAEAARTRGRRSSRRRPTVPERVCPWCSSAVPENAPSCPNCGATLDTAAAEAVPIPGLTEVPPELRRYAEKARTGKKRMNVLGLIFAGSSFPTDTDATPPSDAAALRPPSSELKAEMARLDAEIAAGELPSGVEPAEPAGSAAPAEPAATTAPVKKGRREGRA